MATHTAAQINVQQFRVEAGTDSRYMALLEHS